VNTSGIPNDHLGYAVTWFGLALVWFVMTATLLWRMRSDPIERLRPCSYISTRGTAPVLNFEQAMLSGLARDGGLYVPESSPRCRRRYRARWRACPMRRSRFA
jgi:hypothetical protein